nr:MAG TPA: hypothetical protein [Caudoviricetes sp.]
MSLWVPLSKLRYHIFHIHFYFCCTIDLSWSSFFQSGKSIFQSAH